MGRFMHEPYPALPARPPTNGLGIAGFVISLVGFIACPLIAPLGLLLSFIALFREPRGFAIAGLIIGLLGSLFFLFVVLIMGAMLLVAGDALMEHGVQGLDATFEMIEVGDTLKAHQRSAGSLPESLDALQIDSDLLGDPWGRPYVYERSADGSTFTLRTSGKDGQPGTPDDMVLDHVWLSEP